MSFAITDLQAIANGFTDSAIIDADAINWVNEAVSALESDTWPEKRFGMYGAKKNAGYLLPSLFARIIKVKTVTNLLTENQASVETDLTGLIAVAGTENYTLSRDTTWSTHGIASAKLVSSSDTAQDMAIKTAITAANISANTYYCFGVRTKSNANTSRLWRVGIVWLDSSDVEIATVYSDSKAVQLSDTWVDMLAISPTNAAKAYVLLQLLDAANGEAIWWDGAMLFEISDAGVYSRNRYQIRRQKIAVDDDNNYELQYISYPEFITSVSSNIGLHDGFKYPLAKMLAARQTAREEGISDISQQWRAEFLADVAKIYNRLEFGESARRKYGW